MTLIGFIVWYFYILEFVACRCDVSYLNIVLKMNGQPKQMCELNGFVLSDGETIQRCNIDCSCNENVFQCCAISQNLCIQIDHCPAVIFDYSSNYRPSTVTCQQAASSYGNNVYGAQPLQVPDIALDPLEQYTDEIQQIVSPPSSKSLLNIITANVDPHWDTRFPIYINHVPGKILTEAEREMAADGKKRLQMQIEQHKVEAFKHLDEVKKSAYHLLHPKVAPRPQPIVNGNQAEPLQIFTKDVDPDSSNFPVLVNQLPNIRLTAHERATKERKERLEGRKRLNMQIRANRVKEFKRQDEIKKNAYHHSLTKARKSSLARTHRQNAYQEIMQRNRDLRRQRITAKAATIKAAALQASQMETEQNVAKDEVGTGSQNKVLEALKRNRELRLKSIKIRKGGVKKTPSIQTQAVEVEQNTVKEAERNEQVSNSQNKITQALRRNRQLKRKQVALEKAIKTLESSDAKITSQKLQQDAKNTPMSAIKRNQEIRRNRTLAKKLSHLADAIKKNRERRLQQTARARAHLKDEYKKSSTKKVNDANFMEAIQRNRELKKNRLNGVR